ncbi:MAG TPA: hypothetical protein VLX32_06190 [Candidatus Acidoferrum sp.]|nr:hypothetical protein [Candidatus Acidoferrum sp.]
MPDETPESNDPGWDRNLREAYVFAREERAQADTLLWEVSAIIWGGQTLLLGFVLEAISTSCGALLLVTVVAGIGIFMASFSDRITKKRSEVCNGMIQVMIDVEDKLKMPIKPQHIITEAYGAGYQTKWSKRLNHCFRFAWLVVTLVAGYRLLSGIFVR